MATIKLTSRRTLADLRDHPLARAALGGSPDYTGYSDKRLFRAMRRAKGADLEALRAEAARRGLQEEVK